MQKALPELSFHDAGSLLVTRLPALRQHLQALRLDPSQLQIAMFSKTENSDHDLVNNFSAGLRQISIQAEQPLLYQWKNFLTEVRKSDDAFVLAFYLDNELCGMVGCGTLVTPKDLFIEAIEPLPGNKLNEHFHHCASTVVETIAIARNFSSISALDPTPDLQEHLRKRGYELAPITKRSKIYTFNFG